jgi:hypothetical protein
MWNTNYHGRINRLALFLRPILLPLRFLSFLTIGVEICPNCGYLFNDDVTEQSGFRGYYQCKRCKHIYFPFRME